MACPCRDQAEACHYDCTPQPAIHKSAMLASNSILFQYDQPGREHGSTQAARQALGWLREALAACLLDVAFPLPLLLALGGGDDASVSPVMLSCPSSVSLFQPYRHLPRSTSNVPHTQTDGAE